MPTIDIPDKICPHCGGTKWTIEKEQRKYHVRTRYRCAKRAQERRNRWGEKNPHKEREYAIKGCERKLKSGYYKTEAHKAIQREKFKKDSSTLSDRYIKYILKHKQEDRDFDITPELIEFKRKQLLLKRKIKQHG